MNWRFPLQITNHHKKIQLCSNTKPISSKPIHSILAFEKSSSSILQKRRRVSLAPEQHSILTTPTPTQLLISRPNVCVVSRKPAMPTTTTTTTTGLPLVEFSCDLCYSRCHGLQNGDEWERAYAFLTLVRWIFSSHSHRIVLSGLRVCVCLFFHSLCENCWWSSLGV